MKSELTDLFVLLETIQGLNLPKQKEYLPLEKLSGRVSAKDIFSDFDFPDKNRSKMDGYALNSSSNFHQGLKVVEHLSANELFEGFLNDGECVRCSTGSRLSEFLDIVIPVEYIQEKEQKIIVNKDFIPKQNYIEKAGNIVKKGDRIISQGDVINHREIERLALCRVNAVEVYKKPTVAIISTGSELTELYIQQNSIMNSNFYMISTFFENKNIPYTYLGIAKDSIEDIVEKLEDASSNYDIVVSFGGTAMGKYDLIAEAIKKAKGKFISEGVNCSPGKTFKIATINQKPVFICPGNPASAAVCIELFLNTFIKSVYYGASFSCVKVHAGFSLRKKEGFYKLIPTKVIFEDNKFLVIDNFSPKINSLIFHGLAIVPKDSADVKEDDLLNVYII